MRFLVRGRRSNASGNLCQPAAAEKQTRVATDTCRQGTECAQLLPLKSETEHFKFTFGCRWFAEQKPEEGW